MLPQTLVRGWPCSRSIRTQVWPPQWVPEHRDSCTELTTSKVCICYRVLVICMWSIWLWSCVFLHTPTAHSVKSSPSPDPEESGAKDELLYRWGHHWSWVVCKDVLCIRCICTCVLLLSRVFVVPFPVSYCSVYFLVHIHSTHTGQRRSVPTISQPSWPPLPQSTTPAVLLYPVIS